MKKLYSHQVPYSRIGGTSFLQPSNDGSFRQVKDTFQRASAIAKNAASGGLFTTVGNSVKAYGTQIMAPLYRPKNVK